MVHEELWLESPWADELTEHQAVIAELRDQGLNLEAVALALGKTRGSINYQYKEITARLADPSKLPDEKVWLSDEEERVTAMREQELSYADLQKELGMSANKLLQITRTVALKRMRQARLKTMRDQGLA